MKVIVNDNQASKERPFPKLMINNSTGTIILAEKLNGRSIMGTVIVNGGKIFEVAQYGKHGDWFVDFEGSVTLSND